MLNRTTRYLLAAIQAILGWEWLMSGGNKLLSGSFPQGLATTLTNNFKDNPNTWYVAFLQQNILPHSLFYGYLIDVNFHFLMGGWVIPGFNPTAAYNEGIDLDALIPPLSLVILIANLAFVNKLTGGNFFKGFTRSANSNDSLRSSEAV